MFNSEYKQICDLMLLNLYKYMGILCKNVVLYTRVGCFVESKVQNTSNMLVLSN